MSSEKAALYHCPESDEIRSAEIEWDLESLPGAVEAGTHRGHNKVFLAVPRTPSSASVFL